MKKSEEKINAYQLLLWEDTSLTEEKRMWMSLVDLEQSQDRLRKGLYREIGELKKENTSLKQMLWDLKDSVGTRDLFHDLMLKAQ